MIASEKIIEVLKDKPLKEHAILMRVNPSGSTDELHAVLMKMREVGQVKFDIHKGLWAVR